jgi:hypothetical protein
LKKTQEIPLMKKIMTIAVATMAMMAAAPAFAAGNNDTATANSSATVIVPITIAKVTGADLKFGTLVEGYAATTVGGTVASPSRTGAGANFEIGTTNGGAFAPAAFTVSGEDTRTANVTTAVGTTGTLTSAELTLSAPATVTLQSTPVTFNVGGVLAAGLLAGPKAGTFSVTVTYQ